jgi:hypothetical protein
VPKKNKPILKRFVFDFETRKWKPEYVLDGKASITTELLVPETPPNSAKKKTRKTAPVDSGITEAGYSYKNPSPTSSVNSMISTDFSQNEYSMYYLESATASGRGTSMSDLSLGESSSDITETSRSTHSDVMTRDLEAILKASSKRRDNRSCEGTDAIKGDLTLLEDIENINVNDLQVPCNDVDSVSPNSIQDIDRDNQAWEDEQDSGRIQKVTNKTQSIDEQQDDLCASGDNVSVENEDMCSSTGGSRQDSQRSVQKEQNIPKEQDFQNQRFRILDAETKEDIGKLR